MIQIQVGYNMYGSQTIELPEGKTWDDIDDHWVRWDIWNVIFKGDDKTYTYELCTGYDPEAADMKRPSSVAIYETDEDGNADYERELG